MPQKENRMRGCNSGLNADNIWREHFRISRQTFQFVGNLVGPHLLRQDTNMRRAIPVQSGKARGIKIEDVSSFYDLTSLSDKRPQVPSQVPSSWFGGLNLMAIALKFADSLNLITGCHSLSDLKN